METRKKVKSKTRNEKRKVKEKKKYKQKHRNRNKIVAQQAPQLEQQPFPSFGSFLLLPLMSTPFFSSGFWSPPWYFCKHCKTSCSIWERMDEIRIDTLNSQLSLTHSHSLIHSHTPFQTLLEHSCQIELKLPGSRH